MLTHFCFARTFNQVQVKIWVDCEHKTAEVMIKEGRLIRMSDHNVPYWQVETPEKCAAWLGEQVACGDGTLSRLEHFDWLQRHGIAPFERENAA